MEQFILICAKHFSKFINILSHLIFTKLHTPRRRLLMESSKRFCEAPLFSYTGKAVRSARLSSFVPASRPDRPGFECWFWYLPAAWAEPRAELWDSVLLSVKWELLCKVAVRTEGIVYIKRTAQKLPQHRVPENTAFLPFFLHLVTCLYFFASWETWAI